MYTQPAREIGKLLERVVNWGWRRNDVFDDWLDSLDMVLQRLPQNVAGLVDNGRYPTDPQWMQTRWEQMAERYANLWEEVYTILAQCVGIALNTAGDFTDAVGDVYMTFAYPNPNTGQYFTPYPVCQMMVQFMVADKDTAERMVHNRVRRALYQGEENPQAILGQMGVLTGMALAKTPQEAHTHYLQRVVAPALQSGNLEPITICDPCVGSGRMLLAMAAQFPIWAIQSGIVQLFGQDIDPLCVKMAKVNLRLHGATGLWIKCAIPLEGVDFGQYVPVDPQVEQAAVAAHNDGDRDTLRNLSHQMRNQARGQQMSMFDMLGRNQ